MIAEKIKNAPRMAMGCWAIGGPFWSGDVAVGYSGTNDVDSVQAIEAAWDSGIRIFDTSAVYGVGHSETLLGKTLGNREEAIIVSKFGHGFDAKTKQMTGPEYDPAYIRDSVKQSLKRLKRDQIDIMLLHLNQLEIEHAEQVFDTLEALRESGQIASFGWSTDYPERLDAMANRAGFSAVQHAMNVFFDAPSLSQIAQKHHIIQLIRSPLAMGVLTGKFATGYSVKPNDVRFSDGVGDGYFTDGQASAAYATQLEAIRDLISVGGRSLAQGALCWLLAKSPNIIPLPGAKNAKQSIENAAALEFGPLPNNIMQEIENILNRPPEGPARAR